MPKCSVKSCSNSCRNVKKKDGVSYFSFPRNPVRCAEWAAIIAEARDDPYYKPFKGSVVCSDLFLPSNIYTTTKGYHRLSRNAEPILHLSKKHRSNDDSNCSSTDDNSDQENIQIQTLIQQNKYLIEGSSNINEDTLEIKLEVLDQTNLEDNPRRNQSPSTSLSIGSILETPELVVMKKKLNLYEKMIQNKNKQINRLQKQNKRLIKKNITLKNSLSALKYR